VLARFLQTPTEASGEAIVRTLAAASSLCHVRDHAARAIAAIALTPRPRWRCVIVIAANHNATMRR
jgi:hypothetical protein